MLNMADLLKNAAELIQSEGFTGAHSLIFLIRYASLTDNKSLMRLTGNTLENMSDMAETASLAYAYAEYYQAEKELEPFEKDYKDTDTAEEATELLEWLEARKGSEPENGYKLYNELDSGYGELTIKGGSNPAVVKVDSDNGYSMMFYVRANETATVNLRDGSFMLKYATGTTWYGGGDLFGPRTKYSLADEVLTYETTYSGNSVYYSTYEVTLYSVLGGNLETESIDADEF